ncbi:MAG: hypothetical protein JWN14_4497 [Chthonomonadales bacterium]|nr:hypothetical protein [Chthonomonadales bacterium]
MQVRKSFGPNDAVGPKLYVSSSTELLPEFPSRRSAIGRA